MDYRSALAEGSILDFPGMSCRIEAEIGRGSNAIVYRGWYPDLLNRDKRHIVLIKELFPYHAKGAVYRNESGAVCSSGEGGETWSLHRSSFEYGNNAHLMLLERYPDQTGANLNTFELNGTVYTVLGFSGGRSLKEVSIGPAQDLRALTIRMLELLDALEAFHDCGLLHMDVAPDNILLLGDKKRERVMLIDYNSVQNYRAESSGEEIYFSAKAGYSPPEVRTMKRSALCPASDMYSVAAVFYRCLTGEELTAFQMMRPSPPDVSQSPCVKDMPETVRSMVNQILRRGLQALPGRRYAGVEDMRHALQELLDRIDGVGITHWALYEAGKRSVERAIRENPSYAYIRDAQSLYPANTRDESGALLSMPEYIAQLAQGVRGSALLTAPGGMGKTTAMLRAVAEQPAGYSAARCAVVYVPLHGWRQGQTGYVCDRILEMLRFKPQTHSFDDARRALDELMEKQIRTRDGERPSMLLLLDGLNEADGDGQALRDELAALSKKPGVRILASSRSDEPSLPFERAQLTALTQEDVAGVLARRGLLLPESEQMQELLKTPLMLSIFLQSAPEEGGQLMVQSRQELMQAYFKAIRDKEIQRLPEDSDEKWQIEAAVGFVLPAIAAGMKRQGGALSDGELLKIVGRCWRRTSSRQMRRIFPRWIGRTDAIRAGKRSAEEWYGVIVHGLLWKRLGLLVRSDGAGYQIAHQIISEHLRGEYELIHRKFVQKRRIRTAAAVLVLAAGMLAFRTQIEAIPPAVQSMVETYVKLVSPKPKYDQQLAEGAMDWGMIMYGKAASIYDAAVKVVDSVAENPEEYLSVREGFLDGLNTRFMQMETQAAFLALENLYQEGYVVPWSGKEVDAERYKELVGFAWNKMKEYVDLFKILNGLAEVDWEWKQYSREYADALRELLDLDAKMAALLYQTVYVPHEVGLYAEDEVWMEQAALYRDAAASLNVFLETDKDEESLVLLLESYRVQREEKLQEINKSAARAAVRYRGIG